jgi:GAF domain-containing protein
MAGESRDREWSADPGEDDGRPLDQAMSLASQFATLTAALVNADTVGQVITEIVATASQVIPGAEVVSVMLRASDGRFHTPVRTDPLAGDLDQIQYQLGEGPCLDAADPAGPAIASSADLAVERAWPRFGPAAAERGMRSVLSTELVLPSRPPGHSGALNVFSSRPGTHLYDEGRDIALLLATHASLALAHTDAVSRAELQASQLRRAIDSRDVIGQAKGILMERRGLSAEQAFDLLRRASQDLNVKLVELARTLATRRSELDVPEES